MPAHTKRERKGTVDVRGKRKKMKGSGKKKKR